MPPLSPTYNKKTTDVLRLFSPSLPPPYIPAWATWARRGSTLSVIMASTLLMVKTMDATQHTFPLLNGNKAILLNFLSFDPTLKSHPKRAPGMHGLPIAVGGSLASPMVTTSGSNPACGIRFISLSEYEGECECKASF